MDNPNIFSAFDGISCAHVGLDRAGINCGRYISSELLFIETPSGILRPNPVIDIVRYHYPSTEFVGDITKVDGHIYRGVVNILLGGSPCQSFSSAGTRDGFNGKSGLFWHFPRLLDEINPEYFLLENVVMKDKWIRDISNTLGVEPRFINSEVVSGQWRPRVYWTNIPYTKIKDHGILLGDQVLGAITGTGKHGHLNPYYKIIPGEKKWKNIGWQDNPYNKSCCLVRTAGHYRNSQGDVIQLTPENCEVLQTLPIGYTGVTGLCKTKRIEAIGNAWTVDVLVEAFFKNLPWATKMKVNPMYLDKNV